MLGLAVTNSGVVSVSVDEIEDDSHDGPNELRSRSCFFEVGTGQRPSMNGFKFTPILIGSDGDNLVFKYGREARFFSVVQ